MSNFLLRTVSGIVFLALMVAGMLFYPLAFAALFFVVMYMCLREFLTISLGERWLLQQKLALLTASTVYILSCAIAFYSIDVRWLAVAIIPLIALSASIVFAGNHDTVEDTAMMYLGILYTTLPFALAPFMVVSGNEFRGYVMLVVFIIIWASDVGAYCVGTLLGQKPDSRKLAPSISPKKSWWGFWGGVVLAAVVAVILHFVKWMDFPLVHCIILGVLISVSCVLGDLFESVWKRRYGVKDSGRCIPGHGGMLDRFDSSLFAIPTAFAYMMLFGLL